MSSQRGNVKKSRPQKYQNKSAFKNVYHDTSKRTQQIVNTEVTGVCARCKDCIDWKIKYKKYKPLSQPKTCVLCKERTVKLAYHVYCTKCSSTSNKCAKCGEKKDVVLRPKLSEAEQASEDRELQFELEQLPERKRRTFMRLQDKGLPTECGSTSDYQMDGSTDGDHGDEDDDDDDDENIDEPNIDSIGCDTQNACANELSENETGNHSNSVTRTAGIDSLSNQISEVTVNENKSCGHQEENEIAKLNDA
ncbi:uncharacterized protein C9orf85 homolog [Mercenaria mercenaria]|uniref:uncharacterized protein C9orf85 homolog n=1 Tax=Mercenaria mercenaria TaxID=6596 RepID=UPI00234EF211|nr:uncharacterized protein C9orf85 homolog [Mercenaria mercenaria]